MSQERKRAWLLITESVQGLLVLERAAAGGQSLAWHQSKRRALMMRALHAVDDVYLSFDHEESV